VLSRQCSVKRWSHLPAHHPRTRRAGSRRSRGRWRIKSRLDCAVDQEEMSRASLVVFPAAAGWRAAEAVLEIDFMKLHTGLLDLVITGFALSASAGEVAATKVGYETDYAVITNLT